MLGLLDRHIPLPELLGNAVQNYIFRPLIYLLDLFFENVVEFDPSYSKKMLVFVGGWSYRCNNLTKKHQLKLSRFYSINKPLDLRERALINMLRSRKNSGTFLVGVHVRRGDYKQFCNGRYWYEDRQYSEWICQVKNQLNQNKQNDVLVVVCSNEEQTPMCGQDVFSKSSWGADMRILQSCDLIIGPPSTFTSWASYSARVPCLHIKSSDQVLELGDARICDC